jgi:3-phenylpropionate/trans-cinnamate dioxygenase ferredoxin reductase subunit
MNNLVIIGTGQSAAQCALTLRRNMFKDNITMIGEEKHLPYQRPPLSKEFLSGEVSLERVFMKSKEFFDQNDVTIFTSTPVISIDRNKKILSLSNQEDLTYNKLVIATGSRVRKLNVEGSSLKNISYLRSIEDANRLKEYFKFGKKLVIVGAGYVGLEVAATAVKKGINVTLIEMENRIMSRTVDPVISKYFDSLHRQNGVEIFLEAALEKFEGEDAVERVICSNGQIIEADGVLIGVGILPNQELAESAGLNCNNGILVDEFGKTEDTSIFACGDCTNHPNTYLNKNLRLESVHNALEQAKTVAMSLLGKQEKYNQVPWFWSDQYDKKLQIVGFSDDHDELVIRGSIEEDNFMLFFLKEGKLIAVNAVNNPKEFLICKKLVANKQKISSDAISNQSVDLKELLI